MQKVWEEVVIPIGAFILMIAGMIAFIVGGGVVVALFWTVVEFAAKLLS